MYLAINMNRIPRFSGEVVIHEFRQ
jgi:hypothetical protein